MLPHALSVTPENLITICHNKAYRTPERVQFELGVLMYRCQHNQAAHYLTDHCSPVSNTLFYKCLHLASSHQVSIPYYQHGFFCCWSNCLELTAQRHAGFRQLQSQKTFLFLQYYCVQHIRGLLREYAT